MIKRNHYEIELNQKVERKKIDKIKELEIELVKVKYANKPDKSQSKLKELIKIHVFIKNLHEIKNEIKLEYTGEFEMVGKLSLGDQIRQTHIRFRNIDDFESYINAIDEGYEAEDAVFNGYFYKISTPQFSLVNRSQYGNDCNFKHEMIEYRGKNWFIPTKGYCFVKCINFLTGKDYQEYNLDFTGKEKRPSNIMTKARVQPFCRENNVSLGYFDETRVFPRSVTERNIALYLYNHHFCLIWKPENVSVNQAFKVVKENFKIVDNYITEENVNSHLDMNLYRRK